MTSPENGTPSPGAHRAFLRTFGLAAVAGAAAMLALVVLVDPYGLYRVVQRPGLNAVKPGLTRYQSEIKLAQAVALRPQAVILGNSRAEIGFDPASPQLAAVPGPAYNLAVPGTGVRVAAAQLAALHAAGVRPSTIVLGVEFLDFLAPAAYVSAPPAAPAAASDFWKFDTLFSLASVKDALRTLRIQGDAEAVTVTAQGFNPLLEYKGYALREGYHMLFRQAGEVSAKSLRRKSPGRVAPEDFAAMGALMRAAADSGADLRLVIYPYHAQMLAMFEQAGAWPLFEQWKAAVAAQVAALRRSHPQARVALYDFSGYGELACDEVPAKAERARSARWYWEAGHFKKELGERVLAVALAAPRPDAPFGPVLDEAGLAANAARIAAERSACAAANPALFEAARALMDKAR